MKNEPILDQKQQKLTKEQQTSLMEQRYYILQDLDNVLGIFAETAEIIKFFEEFPDHQMVTNAQNRLIAQINISNTIHFDQKDVDDPLLVGNLKDLKSLAKEYFEEIRQSIPFTDKIDHVADHYVKQNLNENNILQQLPGVQSNSKANFTPGTIKKVIDAMNQVDTIMGKIRAGQNVDIPSKEEFKQKMKARQLNAQEKLKQNFKMEYEESQKLKQKKGNQIKEEKTKETYCKDQEDNQKNENSDQINEEEGGINPNNKNQLKQQIVNKQIKQQEKKIEIKDINSKNNEKETYNKDQEDNQKKENSDQINEEEGGINLNSTNHLQQQFANQSEQQEKKIEIKHINSKNNEKETYNKDQEDNQKNENPDQINDEEGGINLNNTNHLQQQFVNQSEQQEKKKQTEIISKNIENNSGKQQQQENPPIQAKDNSNQLQQSQEKKAVEENQNLQQIQNPPKNENGQITTVNMIITKNLIQLHQELQPTKLNEEKIQALIKSMKKEIELKDLVQKFEEINKFYKDSEMSKLFKLILSDIPKKNSDIKLSQINREKISDDEIKKLNDYIKKQVEEEDKQT